MPGQEAIVMVPEDGAASYENWRAALAGAQAGDSWEYPLFSDAELTGEITEGFGPYMVLNALRHGTDPHAPAAFLRLQYHLTFPLREMTKTDDQRYHGGFVQDELAALLSLALGFRLIAGPPVRHFQAKGDEKGRPTGFLFGGQIQTQFTPNPLGPLLPRALGQQELTLPDVVRRFPELSMEASVAVILAARLYQQAIWTAESNPAYAWLLLVSAIESAAVYWRKHEDTPVERMRASRPELEGILDAAGGNELVSRVAELIAPYMGATKRFVDFTLRFLPAPPAVRPPVYSQHPWNTSALKRSLVRIYGHRSTALHAGIPFPAPMCWPQRRSGDAYDEHPGMGGSAAAQGDHVWLARDIPMTLQFFEHIARGALLNWWVSLATSSER